MDPEFDRRCRQRLREHLGVDDEAVEVIMHLRSQVMALQSRLRELESITSGYQRHTVVRLTRYHETVTEGTWIEISGESDAPPEEQESNQKG